MSSLLRGVGQWRRILQGLELPSLAVGVLEEDAICRREWRSCRPPLIEGKADAGSWIEKVTLHNRN